MTFTVSHLMKKIFVLIAMLLTTTFADYQIDNIEVSTKKDWKSIFTLDEGVIYYNADTEGTDYSELYTFNINTQVKTQLTQNNNYESFSSVDNGTYVWNGINNEFWFFDGTQNIDLNPGRLSSAYYSDIDDGKVVYTLYDGTQNDVYFYDGNQIHRITNNTNSEYSPKISGNQIVWTSSDPITYNQNIYLWEDFSLTQLTFGGSNYNPVIEDGLIAWQGSPDKIEHDIFVYNNGVITNITNSDEYDSEPTIDNGVIYWKNRYFLWVSGRYGYAYYEIMQHKNNVTSSITGQDLNYSNFRASNGQVIMIGEDKVDHERQIYHFDGENVSKVTLSSISRSVPFIENDVIIWSEYENNSNLFKKAIKVDFDQNSYYKIVSKFNGKALDIAGNLENGANIQQWSYHGGKNQLWKIEPVDQGYKITSKLNGKALDLAEWATWNGGNIHQWDYVGSNNQKWNLEKLANGSYKVENIHSGKVLDVDNWAWENGGNIQQWDYVGGVNQEWELVKVPWEFRWLYEDKNENGAFDYSHSAAPASYNFLMANSWTNLVMSNEQAYEGSSALKISLDHNTAQYAEIFIPTTAMGSGTEPVSQEDFEVGKDISKARYLTFMIKGNANTNFTIALLQDDNRNTPSVPLSYYNYKDFTNEWVKVTIPMWALYDQYVDYTRIEKVWFRVTAAEPLEQMEFYIDNIKFVE